MQACFLPADILLPDAAADVEKWAVVACDQFTSQMEYWQKAAQIVGDAPSTLNIVYPEVYLAEGDARIERIRRAMADYMQRGVLQTRVKNGFVFVRRVTESGERLGLVGKLDLEQYDFTPGTSAPVRATEGTILSRIPPRVRIRQGAPIESPHVMMLVDDAAMRLIEPLAQMDLPKLYDTQLMLGGGHISGFAVEGEPAARTAELIAQMQRESGGFFLAVGDGNHSLATAKACWEQIKLTLSEAERENHPARFALCELVNLHSPALVFRPIHRVVFGADIDALQSGFELYLRAHGMTLTDGGEVTLVQGGERRGFAISGRGDRLPVDVLQKYLDQACGERAAVAGVRAWQTRRGVPWPKTARRRRCSARWISARSSRRSPRAACCPGRRSPWARRRRSGIIWSAGRLRKTMKKKWPQKNDKEETQKGRDSIKDEKDWIPEEETKRHFKLKR